MTHPLAVSSDFFICFSLLLVSCPMLFHLVCLSPDLFLLTFSFLCNVVAALLVPLLVFLVVLRLGSLIVGLFRNFVFDYYWVLLRIVGFCFEFDGLVFYCYGRCCCIVMG